MAHTSGPWFFSPDRPREIGISKGHDVAAESGENIAIVLLTSDITSAEVTANARLIAAAPRLLEALQEAEEYFDQRADAEYFPSAAAPIGNAEMTILVGVRAAIAEATGGK